MQNLTPHSFTAMQGKLVRLTLKSVRAGGGRGGEEGGGCSPSLLESFLAKRWWFGLGQKYKGENILNGS